MENTNLKPVIRFPEFTEDWKETKFKNHFEFKNTNSLSRDKLNYESGSVKNIHYGDIHTKFNTHFDIRKEELPFINEDVDISRIDEDNYVLEGDLVMADASEDYADIGKTIEVTNTNNEKILAGLHTFLARKTDETLACGFFGHLLTNYNVRLELMRIAQGTKVLGLSKGRVEKITLALPEPDEQKKIADFLSSIETRISSLKEKKDTLLDFKKGVMQKIFNQEIRFKDDNGNDFPDWIEKRVDKLFDVTRGNVLAVPSMRQKRDNIYKYPVYSSQTKDNGLTGYYDEYLFENSITWTTDGANAGEVKFRKGKFYCTNVCGVLISSENANACIAELLNRITHKYVSYVGNPKLMNNIMAGIKTFFPSPEEQIKIANYLTALDDKIDALQQKIETSVDFKKGLLQKMFV
jgi:type I restriction enzyme S subunit